MESSHPISFLKHRSFLGSAIREFADVYYSGKKTIGTVMASMRSEGILDPIDIAVLVFIVILYKPLLQAMYKVINSLQPTARRKAYQQSLFGYLEDPVNYHAKCLPVLYMLDIIAVVLKTIGLSDIQLIPSAGKWNLVVLFHHIFTGFLCGSYITKLKDYLIQQRWRPKMIQRGTQLFDEARKATVDELSSLAIWGLIVFGILESLSKKFGFGMGSVFALGGIGSASIILALRSTFENFSGGVLLKLQDKFRVGDHISMLKGGEEGRVVDIHYLNTHVRKSDDSLVTIPNHLFTSGEVINWSRTPYRKFATSFNIPMDQVDRLPGLINAIRDGLGQLPQLELRYHDLVVAATTFDASGNKIIVKIEAHFSVSNEREADELHTQAIAIIANAYQPSANTTSNTNTASKDNSSDK